MPLLFLSSRTRDAFWLVGSRHSSHALTFHTVFLGLSGFVKHRIGGLVPCYRRQLRHTVPFINRSSASSQQ